MIIALTGSSGSIGKELLPFLHSLGHQVIEISSTKQSNSKTVFNYDELKNRKMNIKVDCLIHLASLNSNLAEELIYDEVELTKTILNGINHLECKKLIFFSTAKVYGENSLEEHIFDELSELKPKCSYSIAKKLCEEEIIIQSKDIGLNSTILRLPPVLNKSKSSNLGKLINLAYQGYPMISLTHGNFNKRSFISMNNIKIVIEFLIKNSNVDLQNEIYNLSDDKYVSLNNLLVSINKKRIYTFPVAISKFIFNIPFLRSFLIKLFGNFMLNNKKLKSHMNVKLKSTIESLSVIFK